MRACVTAWLRTGMPGIADTARTALKVIRRERAVSDDERVGRARARRGLSARPPCGHVTLRSAVRSLALGLGNFGLKMPNLQEESLGTGEEPDDLAGQTRDVGDE